MWEAAGLAGDLTGKLTAAWLTASQHSSVREMSLWGINGRNHPEEKSDRNRTGSLVIERFPIRKIRVPPPAETSVPLAAAGPAVRASVVPIIPASPGACLLISWEPEEPRTAGTDCWQPSVLTLSVT